MSPSRDATKALGFDRTLSNLHLARRFLVFALSTLPASAEGMSKDLIHDARDGIDLAIDALEEQRGG